MRVEMRCLAKNWWCKGGGAAVLALLAVVITFRRPHDLIFWAAIVFFVGHTAIAIRRWLKARRVRITATVIRHHERQQPMPYQFPPAPLQPARVAVAKGPKLVLQQTKNSL